MAFQMVCSFFGQSTPSRSRVHEPIIDSESFGNQGGNSPYDIRDVGKSANSNWFELARYNKEASESGRKPHKPAIMFSIFRRLVLGMLASINVGYYYVCCTSLLINVLL